MPRILPEALKSPAGDGGRERLTVGELLVVVHPGSLCGSVNMHLGIAAESTRHAVTSEICEWAGAVAVIGGDFDDELEHPRYASLRAALSRASFKVYGAATDLGLKKAARRILRRFRIDERCRVTVTGAWHDHDGNGCVTCVAKTMMGRAGGAVAISKNAPASDD